MIGKGEVGEGWVRRALNAKLKNLDSVLQSVRNHSGRNMIIMTLNHFISRLSLLMGGDLEVRLTPACPPFLPTGRATKITGGTLYHQDTMHNNENAIEIPRNAGLSDQHLTQSLRQRL